MFRKLRVLVFVLLLACVLAAAPASAATGTCQRAAVPAYFYPSAGSSAWDTMRAGAPYVELAIMNPASGPGNAVNADYVRAVQAAQQKGIKLLGYVHTSYGARALADVQKEINHYIAWYGVNGIFVDEAASSANKFSYYQTLYNSIKGGGRLVVLNPGVYPAQKYMSISDVIMVENTGAAYKTMPVPSWVYQYQRNHFWYVIHSVPKADKMTEFITLAQQRHARYVYMTDDVMPNPYDRLPSYWKKEINKFKSTC